MLKKILAVFSVIFILVALSLPAFAYDTPWDWYDTRWRFDSTISGQSWGGTLFDVWDEQLIARFAVDDFESVWTDPEWDGIRLSFYSSAESERITIYDEQGWLDSDFRTIEFDTGPQQNIPQLVQWMANNAICVCSGNTSFPSIRVTVSGAPDHDFVAFYFSGSTPSSPITLTVASSGCLFTHGLRNKFFPSVDSSRFLGLDANGDGVADYVPGQSYEIGSGFTSATTISLSAVYDVTPSRLTSLAIRSNSGSSTYLTDVFTGYGTSPVVRIEVKGYGADIYSDGVFVNSLRLENSDEFLGFSTRKNSLTATYAVGSTITVGGSPDNAGIELFTVYRSAVASPDADWTSWIATAVGGFFSFELWPGLSLGDLLLTVVSIGVFFAFLKMTL